MHTWHLGAVASAASTTRLAEDGLTAGRVGQESVVTIDVRDTCGLPLTRGGDGVGVIELVASGDPASGSLPATVGDRGDGLYTVAFTPGVSGLHTLRATVGGVETSSFAFDVSPAFEPRCNASSSVTLTAADTT